MIDYAFWIFVLLVAAILSTYSILLFYDIFYQNCTNFLYFRALYYSILQVIFPQSIASQDDGGGSAW